MPELAVAGTKDEKKQFTESYRHYLMAKEDLETRITDFDKKDILFRSHIPEADWPYRSLVFDPRVFTALFEKTSRILASKPRGRMVPREGGDALGAKINNELLSFQWDDNERVEGTPMLAKWGMMDLNTRKYGASFALAKWHWQKGKNGTYFDGPNFRPLANRDCLANPSYSTIKNWFQYRDYVTFQELAETNDASRGKPIYKNLDILRDKLLQESQKGGDTRASNYVVKNLAIKGLEDYLGRDEVFRTIEIITEYRPDRWITFSPKHGVILRDIPNPYKHSQIPVVMLKYYPIDDDLYGLSEIEPVEKLQKVLNALICQYLDTVNMTTYPIIKVRSRGGAVQMQTLEFGPGKKWLMDDPQTDVVSHQFPVSGVGEFATTYRFIVGAMQEALGETSAAVSNLAPGAERKTATEIRDLAIQRSARDNFNQMFLAEAIKKQMMFWHSMNQQFLFSNPQERQKVIRIVGKDAIKFFQQMGLDGEGLTQEAIDTLTKNAELPMGQQASITPEELTQPLFPVRVGEETIPKFNLEEGGQTGSLILEPEDLSGNYDYVPDIQSMELPNEQQLLAAVRQVLEVALNPITTQLLAQDQYKLKTKEVLEDYFERLGMKDADKYFEKIQTEGGLSGEAGILAQQGGAGSVEAGQPGMANEQYPGFPGGFQAVSPGQAQPIVS